MLKKLTAIAGLAIDIRQLSKESQAKNDRPRSGKNRPFSGGKFLMTKWRLLADSNPQKFQNTPNYSRFRTNVTLIRYGPYLAL
ncbi:hypothetical protein [Methylomonas koyamae]|uniref:hypothetical protein n=1 Tax=Methylomonas koyamae TaxID=702114 RepID=UPI00112DF201|nr:hypothetical protein [Methylomonas koyamae]